MKLKKLVSLLLVGAMAGALLTGCGGSDSNSEEAVGSAAEEAGDDEELTEIEVYCATLFGASGVEEVEDAVNEITEEEIGVHVNLNQIEMASYVEQISLMFSSQETMDLLLAIPNGSAGYSSLVAQKQLQPLNDLLDENAPELKAEMERYLAGTTSNGNTYTVPVYRQFNSDAYIVMRADVLDDLGLREKAENMTSWSEYLEIAKAVVDSDYDNGKVTTVLANNSSVGSVISLDNIMTGNENWEDNYSFDNLGDTFRMIAVDEETDSVYSYYQSEDYYNMLALMNQMYNDGYVYKDAATTDDSGETLMASDIAFSFVTTGETGVEQSKATSTGKEVVCTKLVSEEIFTGSATKFSWGVPITAEEPEAAVKFLNLMYTNETIENLLVWGIEGRDYELNDEGEAVRSEDAVYKSNDFLWGNQFLAYPAAGQGSDFREKALEETENATLSKYFGCSVDTSTITNELTAVDNVVLQYQAAYESGSTSAGASYDEFVNGDFYKALDEAGMQTVLDEYQAQLDAWLAEQ